MIDFKDDKKGKASDFEEAFFSFNETFIHPTAIVGKNVTFEEGVKVGPFCIIVGNVKIGAGTRLHSNVTVGYPAQVVGAKECLGTIEIGKNCELREFVTIHASRYPDGQTKMGDNCYVMNFSHVGHDCILENNVTLINNVNLGGHTYVEKNVIIMANSATHQFCRIGKFSAIAPYSGTRQDLPPFNLFNEQPAKFAGLNVIGLRRAGINRESINAIKHLTKLFYKDKLLMDKIKELAAAEPTWGQDEHVQYFIKFVENSTRGVSRRSVSDAANDAEQDLA